MVSAFDTTIAVLALIQTEGSDPMNLNVDLGRGEDYPDLSITPIMRIGSIKALFAEIPSYWVNVFSTFQAAFHANDPKSHPILSLAPEFVSATPYYSPIHGPIPALGVKNTVPQ